MGYFWFSILFSCFIIALGLTVIPWIVGSFIIECIRGKSSSSRKKKSAKEKGSFKDYFKFTVCLIAFVLVVVFVFEQSIPYFKDLPKVVKGEFKTENGIIDFVSSAGKDGQREIDVNGYIFITSKIVPKSEGEYVRFEYLPNTKIIVDIKMNEE